MAEAEGKKKTGGLAGVVAGNTSICLCSAEDEKLLYRGYPVEELAEYCSFEEVAWLLLHHDLPNAEELEGFCSDLHTLRALSPSIKQILEQLPPTVNLMDALRSCVSILGHTHPESEEADPFLIPERVIASLGSMLLYWYHFHTSRSRIDLNTGEKTYAGHILHLITGKIPSQEEVKALNISLILYAEHEFNASTFTVRVIASTLSDYYSAICGGIGALSGPLHGGANERAMLLMESFTNPEDAERGILQKLQGKELVMGFGHRVYTKNDPRSAIILKEAKRLAKTPGQKDLLAIGSRIETVMRREKNLFPNLDFYSGLTYHFLGIHPHFFTPLFVMARIAGWTAHFFEQREHNKLIRPIGNYTGPTLRHWIPVEKRHG
jgi:2-methylcitrate synthase